MPLQPLRPRRLYREIANQLLDLIARGEYPPGSRLPSERELCASLDVSRTAVREALIALELAGAIEVRTGTGIRVRRDAPAVMHPASEAFSPFETLGVRLLVEPEAARLAALHATPAQRAALADALRRLSRGPLPQRREADRQFHVRIAEASGNPALAFVVDELWRRGSTPMWSRLDELAIDDARIAANVGEHKAVLEAVRARDGDAAQRAMRTHLRNAGRSRLGGLDRGR